MIQKYAWVKKDLSKVSVQGVVALGGYFATLYQELDFYKAKFEFSYHSKLAINAGLSEKIIQNLREGAEPEFNDPRLDLAYRITNQLLQSHSVDDKAYTEGINEFGEQGMIELVSLVGYYCLVSLTLNIFEVPLDNGMEDPFPNKK